MAVVQVKPGREKSLLRRHPWVFSGAVASVQGDPGVGETVEIQDAKGNFLARGAYSPYSQIRLRVWTWEPDRVIGPDFFRERLGHALAARQDAISPEMTDAYRLVHAESDGLPGLIADRYGDVLVVQFLSSGAEYWRETLAGQLQELTGARHVYERSDVDVRVLEGLEGRTGAIFGGEPADRLTISENGLRFWIDYRKGHKTGFYLDQRANRARLRDLANGRRTLDCFAYTGGFTVSALAGGASSVTAIDSSAEALALARENVALNALPGEQVEWVVGDVFQTLRKYRDQDRSYDLIVLDPPKFAPTASQAQRAARGYKDINLLAFKLLSPGGLLVTFSCSGGVSEDLFQKIVAGAALDAGVNALLLERLHQGMDHPVALNFPEGAYLKGFVLRVS
ncbi:MAG TPA: class I SAM-dependent methyltransferase [Anaerolineales bacterium]